jgi:hypothetical protein
MAPLDAQRLLGQPEVRVVGRAISGSAAEDARKAVGDRLPMQPTGDPLAEPASELLPYLGAFWQHADSQPFRAEGWCIKLADLRRVIAVQPMVNFDDAEGRTESANRSDLVSIARITLPIDGNAMPPVLQCDPARHVWTVTSRNQNLQIVGHFNSPVTADNGRQYMGCGFVVAIAPSFLQVARFRDRLVLRDGYHRALGLLSRGITHAPVLFREFGPNESLGLDPGALPEAAYLGPHPPYLPDFFSETVSLALGLPAAQKILVVQGLELFPNLSA